MALIAHGEQHAPEAVQFIADNVETPQNVRRGLGALFRDAARRAPDWLNFQAAEDPETYEALKPAIERKECPAYQAWADAHWKYKLDHFDRMTLDYLNTSDERERAAIRSEYPLHPLSLAGETAPLTVQPAGESFAPCLFNLRPPARATGNKP